MMSTSCCLGPSFSYLRNTVYLINVLSRFEGPKRFLKFFQRSLKIQENLSALPPPKHTNISLYDHLGIPMQ